jgi:hypothetical protein
MSNAEAGNSQPAEETGSSRREILRKGLALGLGTGALVVTSQLVTANPAHAGIQSGWRYCNRCRSLVWGSGGGNCAHPSYSSHNWSGTYNYIMHDVPDPLQSSAQRQWAYCPKCKGMFFYYYAGTPHQGDCPAGAARQGFSSYEYLMPTVSAGDRQGNWRNRIQCEAMFWGGAEANSHCPTNSDGHDRGGSWNYYLQFTI